MQANTTVSTWPMTMPLATNISAVTPISDAASDM